MFKRAIIAGLLGLALLAGEQDSAFAKEAYVTHIHAERGEYVLFDYDVYIDDENITGTSGWAQVPLKYVNPDSSEKKAVIVTFYKNHDGAWGYTESDYWSYRPNAIKPADYLYLVLKMCGEKLGFETTVREDKVY